MGKGEKSEEGPGKGPSGNAAAGRRMDRRGEGERDTIPNAAALRPER